jgi:hypothetical protein
MHPSDCRRGRSSRLNIIPHRRLSKKIPPTMNRRHLLRQKNLMEKLLAFRHAESTSVLGSQMVLLHSECMRAAGNRPKTGTSQVANNHSPNTVTDWYTCQRFKINRSKTAAHQRLRIVYVLSPFTRAVSSHISLSTTPPESLSPRHPNQFRQHGYPSGLEKWLPNRFAQLANLRSSNADQ